MTEHKRTSEEHSERGGTKGGTVKIEKCSIWRSRNGRASPRTCELCGLGPCRQPSKWPPETALRTFWEREHDALQAELDRLQAENAELREALEQAASVLGPIGTRSATYDKARAVLAKHKPIQSHPADSSEA